MSTPLDSNELLSIDYDPRISGGPVFDTTVVSTASGIEQRNINRWDPLWIWRVQYSTLKPSQFDALAAFFTARLGRYQSFLFRRPYAISDVRARFNQDELRGEQDRGGVSSVQLEVLEVLTGTGSTPPTTFAADSGENLPLTTRIAANITGGASFSTTVISIPAGVERRTQNRPNVRRWTIEFGGLALAEINTLLDFFLARKGQAQTFLFTPPEGGSAITCRFGQDDFSAVYENNETGWTGGVDILEVL